MPMIRVKCPKCTKSLSIADTHVGKQVKCPGCGHVFRFSTGEKGASSTPPESVHAGNPLQETVDSAPRQIDGGSTSLPDDAPTVMPNLEKPADRESKLSGDMFATGTYAPSTSIASSQKGSTAPKGPRAVRMAGYEILGELGRGGMGVVYRARHLKLGHEVALKMILAGGHASERDLARFQLEAAAVARLHHPAIIHMYEFGEHEGKPFFTLEFVDGESLSRFLKNGPMSARAAAAMIEKLARAMHHAHEAGIIHRDLKPANVLLTKDNEPKIADFGLAKDLDTAEGLSQSGAVMGTPAYMAPEQAQGRIRELGPATDIYALGAILYECLTGRVPFKAPTLQETLVMVCSDEPVSPRSLVPKLPRDLETICLRCLEKSAKKRYATAADLADDLARFQRGEPVMARPVGRLERGLRWCKRNPAAVVVAAALLLGVGVSTMFGFLANAEATEKEKQRQKVVEEKQRGDSEKEAKLAALQREGEAQREKASAEAERARAIEEKAKAFEERLKTIDKLQSIAFTSQLARVDASYQREPHVARIFLNDEIACPKDMRDFSWGLYNNWSKPATFEIQRAVKTFFQAVSASPDGKTAAIACADGTVQLLNLPNATGHVRLTIKAHQGETRCVAYHPDGKSLASAGADGAIRFWNPDDGKELRACKEAAGPVLCLSFSGDGKTLASAHGSEQIILWNPENGAKIAAISTGETGDTSAFIALSPDGKKLATFGNNKDAYILGVPGGAELAVLERQHQEPLGCVVFSPDGNTVVTGDLGGAVKVWDLATEKVRFSLEGHGGAIRGLNWTPDGKTLFSASEDGTCKHWDTATGKELRTFKGVSREPDRFVSQSLSADGKWLVATNATGAVRYWDAATGAVGNPILRPPFSNWVVCFSPDGRLLAGGDSGGTVWLWDTLTRKERPPLLGHGNAVRALAFSPDGATLASGSDDNTLRLWDVKTGKERANQPAMKVTQIRYSSDGKRILVGGQGIRLVNADTGEPLPIGFFPVHRDVTSLNFFRDEKEIVILSSDTSRFPAFFDVETGRTTLGGVIDKNGITGAIAFSPDGKLMVHSNERNQIVIKEMIPGGYKYSSSIALDGHLGPVSAIRFRSDGKTLATAGLLPKHLSPTAKIMGEIKLWDLKTMKEISTVRTDSAIGSFDMSKDGMMAVCDNGPTARVWDRSSGPENTTILAGHMEGVGALALSADGATVASAGMDGTVRLWDPKTGRQRHSLRCGEAAVGVCFRPDGKAVAAVGTDGLRVWETETGKEIARLPGSVEFGPPDKSSGFVCVAYSPDGKTLAVSGMNETDRVIKLYDAGTLKERGTLTGHTKRVRALGFAAQDAMTLASAGDDGFLRVWNLSDNSERKAFGDGKTLASAVRLSEDGARLLVLNMDGNLRRLREWDVKTGEEGPPVPLVSFDTIKSLTGLGPTFAFNDRVFSADGKTLAVVHDDRTIKLYETRYGQVRASFPVHADKVLAVCFSADGKTMATSGADGTIKLWFARFE